MLQAHRYEEIADDLREQIRRGRYPAGERLPGERVMMAQYGVQRNTVRQALTLLQNEGWLQVRARSGAFAASPDALKTSPTPRPSRPVIGESVLIVNSWNRASTALDRILIGLAASLEDTPLSLLRFNSHPRPDNHRQVVPTPEYLDANRVAGTILWPQSPTDPNALRRLRDAAPLVLVDRPVLGFEADYVGFGDVSGGRMITQHLLSLGHRRIGFLGDDSFAETVQQRWRGYSLALEEAGIPYDATRVMLFETIRPPLFPAYMRIFLAGAGEPLSAVVCSNDTTALNLLRFLRDEGVRVPDDLAVTGYGNLLADYLDTLDLTTAEQPFEELGRVAGELLKKRLSDVQPPEVFEQVELPVRLIVRNSTATPLPPAG